MFEQFENKKIKDIAKHREDLSYYNHNYYEDIAGNMIYVVSDDDNHSVYFLSTERKDENGKDEHEFFLFGESFASSIDIVRCCNNQSNHQQVL